MQFSKMNGNIEKFLKIPKVLNVVKRDLKAQLVVACSRTELLNNKLLSPMCKNTYLVWNRVIPWFFSALFWEVFLFWKLLYGFNFILEWRQKYWWHKTKLLFWENVTAYLSTFNLQFLQTAAEWINKKERIFSNEGVFEKPCNQNELKY